MTGIATPRRRFLSRATDAVTAPAVLRQAQAVSEISVSSYDGTFEETLRLAIYPEFEQQTGITINSVPQAGGNRWFQTLENDVVEGTNLLDVAMCGW